MKKALILLRNQARGKRVLVVLALTNLVYLLLIGIVIPQIRALSKGLELFDLMPFGYSFEHAQNLLANLGEEGREIYLRLQIPIDMLYPLLFGYCYSLTLVYLMGKIAFRNPKWLYLALLPWSVMILDWLENLSVMRMLLNYPSCSDLEVGLSSLFTIGKSLLTFISLVLLLVLFSNYVYVYMKQKVNR